MAGEAQRGGSSAPFVVVLTGGPCSGKSSAMAILRDRLSKRGFQCLTVPENATHFLANSDGFQPEWVGKEPQVKMQRIFLDYQLHQEEAFKSFAALHPTKPAVLLLDRCVMDSKIYLSDEQWEEVLRCPGHPLLEERGLLQRYDLVIHMVTCALEGHYEWGPGSNNPARYHTPDQAAETDDRGLKVFAPHQQLRVVPHFAKLNDKILQVLSFVNDALHIEGLAGKRQRKTVRVCNAEFLKEVVAQASTTSYVATTTFLDDDMQQSVRRCAQTSGAAWLDKWTRRSRCPAGTCQSSEAEVQELVAAAVRPKPSQEAPAGVMYERRKHVRAPNDPSSSYLARNVMTEDNYYSALEDACGTAVATEARRTGAQPSRSATKCALGFLSGHQYYELFFFLGRGGLVLDIADEVALPSCLAEVVEESCKGQPLQDTAEVDGNTKDGTSAAADADCASVFLSTEPAPSKNNLTGDAQSGAKRTRRLWRHTTEEAAHGLAEKRPKLMETSHDISLVSQDAPAAGA